MNKALKKLVGLGVAIVSMMLYTVIVYAQPAQVKNIQQTAANNTTARITWDAVAGDKVEYELRMAQNANFSGTTKVLTASKNNIYLQDLVQGKSYYVKIRALINNETGVAEYGQESEVFEVITKPGTVTDVIQSAATKTTATIKWKAATGASYYSLKVNNKEIAKVTGTTYTFKKLPDSQVYIYPVKTSSTYTTTGIQGRITNANIAFLPKKASKPYVYGYTKDMLRFAWDEVKYAQGYQFEYYNYKGSKRLGKKTTKNTSVNINIKSNCFYKVRVRAYINVNGKKNYGEWSKYNYVCGGIESEKIVPASSDRVKLSWKKVKGATKYTIYTSTDGKKYKKAKTTKKTSYTVTKINKSRLQQNKQYYIYVVASKKVGKKTYKSIVPPKNKNMFKIVVCFTFN